MASFVYNNAKSEFLKGTLDWVSDTFKIMLVNDSYAENPDHDFVSSATSGELAATNYTPGFGGAGRKTLASKTVTIDDTSDRAEADAADVTWTALGGALNDTIAGAIIIKEVASDADSLLIAYLDPADLTTNGSDVTLQLDADGVFYI